MVLIIIIYYVESRCKLCVLKPWRITRYRYPRGCILASVGYFRVWVDIYYNARVPRSLIIVSHSYASYTPGRPGSWSTIIAGRHKSNIPYYDWSGAKLLIANYQSLTVVNTSNGRHIIIFYVIMVRSRGYNIIIIHYTAQSDSGAL